MEWLVSRRHCSASAMARLTVAVTSFTQVVSSPLFSFIRSSMGKSKIGLSHARSSGCLEYSRGQEWENQCKKGCSLPLAHDALDAATTAAFCVLAVQAAFTLECCAFDTNTSGWTAVSAIAPRHFFHLRKTCALVPAKLCPPVPSLSRKSPALHGLLGTYCMQSWSLASFPLRESRIRRIRRHNTSSNQFRIFSWLQVVMISEVVQS
jgi:hypothetical protein